MAGVAPRGDGRGAGRIGGSGTSLATADPAPYPVARSDAFSAIVCLFWAARK